MTTHIPILRILHNILNNLPFVLSKQYADELPDNIHLLFYLVNQAFIQDAKREFIRKILPCLGTIATELNLPFDIDKDTENVGWFIQSFELDSLNRASPSSSSDSSPSAMRTRTPGRPVTRHNPFAKTEECSATLCGSIGEIAATMSRQKEARSNSLPLLVSVSGSNALVPNSALKRQSRKSVARKETQEELYEPFRLAITELVYAYFEARIVFYIYNLRVIHQLIIVSMSRDADEIYGCILQLAQSIKPSLTLESVSDARTSIADFIEFATKKDQLTKIHAHPNMDELIDLIYTLFDSKGMQPRNVEEVD
jgi:hypothetical protein